MLFFINCVILLLSFESVAIANLEDLELSVAKDLKWINYPPSPWRTSSPEDVSEPILDVAIIGSGMAGLCSAFSLLREGISNICVFDENPAGYEGPWITYARMKVLRSSKSYMGPALNIPNLTFHAYYEALFGPDAWRQLKSVPTPLWMDYLNWYKQVLNLPVENQICLVNLSPLGNLFQLDFQQLGQTKTILARKVVLATGRGGFGGPEIPETVQQLPKSFYFHTAEGIDFELLKGKTIAVIGSGASAFDAAAVALENGALKVDLLLRRAFIPYINKFVEFAHPGIIRGFYYLSDEMRSSFLSYALENGIPPPHSALLRVKSYPNFQVIPNSSLESLKIQNGLIIVSTGQGIKAYDYFLIGTGFNVNGAQRPELHSILDQILLWNDQLPYQHTSKLGRFPYLGPHFEFKEKNPGSAPYLKNIYCFNYGATLSHGLVSGDIPNISYGAARLAEGIAADFFVSHCSTHFEELKAADTPTFHPDEFEFLNLKETE